MNPQSWIALAAIAVSTLVAVMLALSRYAAGQREKAVDAKIMAVADQVKAVDGRVTSVEGKFEAKLDAILMGQGGIQKELAELRARMEFERGSRCGVDDQVRNMWETLVTREVFDARMTGLDREIRDIKQDISELAKRRG